MFNFRQHIWDAKGQGAFVPRKPCCPLGISVGESVDTGQYGRQHSSVPASGAKIEAVIFLSHWERKKKKNEFLSCQKGVLCVHRIKTTLSSFWHPSRWVSKQTLKTCGVHQDSTLLLSPHLQNNNSEEHSSNQRVARPQCWRTLTEFDQSPDWEIQ